MQAHKIWRITLSHRTRPSNIIIAPWAILKLNRSQGLLTFKLNDPTNKEGREHEGQPKNQFNWNIEIYVKSFSQIVLSRIFGLVTLSHFPFRNLPDLRPKAKAAALNATGRPKPAASCTCAHRTHARTRAFRPIGWAASGCPLRTVALRAPSQAALCLGCPISVGRSHLRRHPRLPYR